MAESGFPPPARTPANATRVLVLQGGGALGSYQAGAYQALCHFGFEPDWVAGISIGAVNAAIIAGNPPEKRVERLKEFWHMVSAPVPWKPITSGDYERTYFNQASAALIATFGVPGFFRPRIPPAPLWPQASPESQSDYDTTPLRATLHRHFGDNLKYSGRIGLTHHDASREETGLPGAEPQWFFAPDQIRKRAKEWGPGGIDTRFGAAWTGFAQNLRGWLTVAEDHGSAAVERIYRETLAGHAPPDRGHILSLGM